MYSLAGYGKMIADGGRARAYARSLEGAVKPGSVVLEIGTGLGVFAVLACRLGAGRVYALEPDEVIHVAREVAAANGCADRIEFIQDFSTRVEPRARADVIISDLRDILPLFRGHIPSIADARERLLAPGGVLIPQQDELWAAVVEASDCYRGLFDAWSYPFDLDMSPARRLATNRFVKAHFSTGQLLAEPRRWATLTYATLDDPNVDAEVTWVAGRAGTGHGLSVWFDSTLSEGVRLSNAPGEPELIYGNAFFPWPEPVCIADGDEIKVHLSARLIGDDYVWVWNTKILEGGRPKRVKADFRQSTFAGLILSPALLATQTQSSRPALNREGAIDRFILGMMGGEASLDEIAGRLAAEFPLDFARAGEALERVRRLSARYCS